MNICVCGGGNLGHVVAGFVAARKGFDVTVLTRRPECWHRQLLIERPGGDWPLLSSLKLVTSVAKEAVSKADAVVLCLPGYSIGPVLRQIRDDLPQEAFVGSVVSSTGFFQQAMHLLSPTQPLFGLQRVPFIARTLEYGHVARLMGYKESLSVAVEQTRRREELRQLMEQLFATPTKLMNNWYEVALSNSNPLLHPSRLYDLWCDYREGETYDRRPLFYEEWTERAAAIYMDMDAELQQLLAALPVAKDCIPTVLDYYESHDAASLAAKLRSIEAFKGIEAPMKEVECGFVHDFKRRYFTEDFPFGLGLLRQLAREKGIATPTMDRVWQWGAEGATAV